MYLSADMKNKWHQTTIKSDSIVMYIDMNSFFAGCEQQRYRELRGKPVGVVTYDSPYAAVIAPSIEAKKNGCKNRYAIK